jgi:hypothetical protein
MSEMCKLVDCLVDGFKVDSLALALVINPTSAHWLLDMKHIIILNVRTLTQIMVVAVPLDQDVVFELPF